MAPLDALAVAPEPAAGSFAETALLNAQYGRRDARSLLELAIEELFPGRIALVSSFVDESAVLLHMLAEIDRTVPVIFLDTGRLFAETLVYRTELSERLGLTDVRTFAPDPERLAAKGPHRAVWVDNPRRC